MSCLVLVSLSVRSSRIALPPLPVSCVMLAGSCASELLQKQHFRLPPPLTDTHRPRSSSGDMSGDGASEDTERAALAAGVAAMTAVFQAGSAKRKRAEESLEEQKSKYALPACARRQKSCARTR